MNSATVPPCRSSPIQILGACNSQAAFPLSFQSLTYLLRAPWVGRYTVECMKKAIAAACPGNFGASTDWPVNAVQRPFDRHMCTAPDLNATDHQEMPINGSASMAMQPPK